MESEKEKHRKWLVEALAANPAMKQVDLADALNLDKSAISNMLKSKRAIKSDELYRMAEFLNHPLPSAGFAENSRPFEPAPDRGASRALAPIFGAVSEEGGWLLRRDEPKIDARPRAPAFENAAQVFGFYAPDDAAAPRFKSGEIVWVDPARPLKASDDALLIERKEGGQHVLVGEFRRATAAEIFILAYHDRKERRYSKTHWKALHILARH